MFLSLFRSFSLKKFILVLFISLIGFSVVTPVFAEDSTSDVQKMYTEFCNRRDSSVVNLEQWYSGKCSSKNPNDRIGFSMIILLDLYEKIAGKSQDASAIQQIFQTLKGGLSDSSQIQKLSDSLNQNDGAINAIAGITGKLLSSPPASSIEYIADVQQNITGKRLVTPAYAASTNGFGFDALQLVMPIWKAMRNFSYFLFTLVFVAYGFMIMFRVKLGAQTVISIQSALPKIIMTLLAITFSYAIAGFMIDMFYVIIGFLFGLLQHTNPPIIADINFAKIATGQSIGIIGPFLVMLLNIFTLPAKILGAFIPQALATLLTVAGAFFGITILIWLLIAIVVLINFLKIIWMMLKSFVNLTLQVMFAPILLLGGIFPKSNSFENWARSIAAELAVFGAIMIGFLLSFYFIGGIVGGGILEIGPLPADKGFFMPPPLGGIGLGADQVNSAILGNTYGKFALLGFGIFLIIPSLAKTVYEAFKIKPLGYGSDIGDALKYGMFSVAGMAYNGDFAGRIRGGGWSSDAAVWGARMLGWKNPSAGSRQTRAGGGAAGGAGGAAGGGAGAGPAGA